MRLKGCSPWLNCVPVGPISASVARHLVTIDSACPTPLRRNESTGKKASSATRSPPLNETQQKTKWFHSPSIWHTGIVCGKTVVWPNTVLSPRSLCSSVRLSACNCNWNVDLRLIQPLQVLWTIWILNDKGSYSSDIWHWRWWWVCRYERASPRMHSPESIPNGTHPRTYLAPLVVYHLDNSWHYV